MRNLWNVPFALLLAVVAMGADAQTFPDRPVRFIVGNAAGTASDVLARQIAQRWGELLGQPVVVDNRAGAGGIIGAELVAKAPPDGYTVMFGGSQINATNPALYKQLPYNPVTDFAAVGRVAGIPMLLVINASIPAKSFAEFVALGRAGKVKLNFASSGNGSAAHMAGSLFNKETGLNAQHVPYKAISQAFTDLISGEVAMMFYPYNALQPHIQAGKVTLLGAATDKRVSFLPQVPTFAELGYPGLVLSPWLAIYAPAGTPRRVVDVLASTLERALTDPGVAKRITDSGNYVWLGGPDELTKFTLSEIDKFRAIVTASGASPQ